METASNLPAIPQPPAGESPAVDVLKHLGGLLHRQWRRYRKRLQYCQQRFSEKAVHDSRVETRRLLATIELLSAFVPERELKKTRRALKRHLDIFAELRDTQMQLVYVRKMARTLPAAPELLDWLRRREARSLRTTRKAVRRIKTKRVGRRLESFEEEIRRWRHHTSPAHTLAQAWRAIDRAFAQAVQLRRRMKGADMATIHKTRVAFKRFRYMVEALPPLPATTGQHQAMRAYQSVMGEIQDLEVLLAAVEKFCGQNKISPAGSGRLKGGLLRRQKQLARKFLKTADRLHEFWPPQIVT